MRIQPRPQRILTGLVNAEGRKSWNQEHSETIKLFAQNRIPSCSVQGEQMTYCKRGIVGERSVQESRVYTGE
jgi:hypothetical protein